MGKFFSGLFKGAGKLMFGGKKRAVVSVGVIVIIILIVTGNAGAPRSSATPTPMKVPSVAPTATLPVKAAPQTAGATPTLPALVAQPTLAIAPTLPASGEVLREAGATPVVAPTVQTAVEVPPYGSYFCGQGVDVSYIWTWGTIECADYGKRVDACPDKIGNNPPLGCTDSGSGKPLGVHRFETGWCWYRETSTWTMPGKLAPVPNATIRCDPYGSGRWQ